MVVNVDVGGGMSKSGVWVVDVFGGEDGRKSTVWWWKLFVAEVEGNQMCGGGYCCWWWRWEKSQVSGGGGAGWRWGRWKSTAWWWRWEKVNWTVVELDVGGEGGSQLCGGRCYGMDVD